MSRKSQPAKALAEIGSVILRGAAVALDTDVGGEFVLDCVRHTEGLVADDDLRTKWGLTDKYWSELPNNTALLDRVRRERERRIFTGVAAQEGAQQYFAKAPGLLAEILNDAAVSPRHRIEAARELRQAANDQNSVKEAQEREKFVIVINLGADEKPFRFEGDVEPRHQSIIEDEQ